MIDTALIQVADDWREIPLTQGQVALVDAGDYEWLTMHRWYAWKLPTRGTFYVRRNLRCEDEQEMSIYIHRFILGLHNGDKRMVDHRNGNGLDNRRGNLRICTVADNSKNQQRHRDNRSGFKGVSFNKYARLWHACIYTGGRKLSLGYYHTPEEAHSAYCVAASAYHGDFARTK